jgi:hypothetical protein
MIFSNERAWWPQRIASYRGLGVALIRLLRALFLMSRRS